MVHTGYPYRIEPTGAQRAMLMPTFGCVRVVSNDVIRAREAAWQAGEKLSNAEVQRRVITEAKRTEARGWLAEVASVPLVQSVQDAMPLRLRLFECQACGLVLDRDVNAALNIPAAGRAERVNACGARVSPASFEGALGDEAGSRGKPPGGTARVAA
ncbi:helix-turn-helix domain-containing protein [Haloactinospora alba]|nr:helix-turn-helix domain-containing protein [Haloactinospora alba]